MKNYQIVLIGNRTITVNEFEQQVVKKEWLRQKTDDEPRKIINIKGNSVDPSTIKGIFEIKEDQFGLNQSIMKINTDFSEDCFKLARLSVNDKVSVELSTRIFPQAFLDQGLIKYSDDLADIIKTNVRNFFEANHQMPRCPAQYWWSTLRKMLRNKRTASFYKIVMRNDDAMADWAKFNHIKIDIRMLLI